MIPTHQPWRASKAARLTTTCDLPTPRRKDWTAMTLGMDVSLHLCYAIDANVIDQRCVYTRHQAYYLLECEARFGNQISVDRQHGDVVGRIGPADVVVDFGRHPIYDVLSRHLTLGKNRLDQRQQAGLAEK